MNKNNFRNARFFTVLADEVANTEQLSLVLLFVDHTGEIREEFTSRIHKCGVTGKALSDQILSNLQKYSLDVNLLRGQGYDGAGRTYQ